MKKLFLFTLLLCSLIIACKSTKKTATTTAKADATQLEGTWELHYITGSRVSFEGLYPHKKPSITFRVADGKISGNTGCNTFIGIFKVNGNIMDFTNPLALSRMTCPGTGETVFLESLKKVNTYNIEGKTLSFMSGGTETMRLEKK